MLKIFVLHLLGMTVGKILKEVDSVPRKFTLFSNEINVTPCQPLITQAANRNALMTDLHTPLKPLKPNQTIRMQTPHGNN